ncbi:MAG: cytochrome c, partial [Bacteroidia bacterium]|nr:cytochrome c [Bacteroidia bacterium]
MPWILTLLDLEKDATPTAGDTQVPALAISTGASFGEKNYQKYCMTCHGQDLKGRPSTEPPPRWLASG